jgi:hypothetical protein
MKVNVIVLAPTSTSQRLCEECIRLYCLTNIWRCSTELIPCKPRASFIGIDISKRYLYRIRYLVEDVSYNMSSCIAADRVRSAPISDVDISKRHLYRIRDLVEDVSYNISSCIAADRVRSAPISERVKAAFVCRLLQLEHLDHGFE